MLYTALQETRIYPMLSQVYHDGTIERSLITDTVNTPVSLRSWSGSARLLPGAISTVQAFYVATQGGNKAFYWYSPIEVLPGHAIGSNYDSTGVSSQGRHTVRFTNQTWNQQVDLARTNISFTFLETA